MLDTLTLDTLTVEASSERTLLAHREEKEERRQASAGKRHDGRTRQRRRHTSLKSGKKPSPATGAIR